MRVTISQDDNLVTVNGVAHKVDCSELPQFVRVIQWDSDRGTGHIEMDPDERGVRMSNLRITSIEPWEFLVERWRIASALQARQERQAKVDETVQEIATHEQMKAQDALQKLARERLAEEQRRARDLARQERERADQMEAEVVSLKTRLDEVERQLESMRSDGK